MVTYGVSDFDHKSLHVFQRHESSGYDTEQRQCKLEDVDTICVFDVFNTFEVGQKIDIFTAFKTVQFLVKEYVVNG
jgi:hypothetical protein